MFSFFRRKKPENKPAEVPAQQAEQLATEETQPSADTLKPAEPVIADPAPQVETGTTPASEATSIEAIRAEPEAPSLGALPADAETPSTEAPQAASETAQSSTTTESVASSGEAPSLQAPAVSVSQAAQSEVAETAQVPSVATGAAPVPADSPDAALPAAIAPNTATVTKKSWLARLKQGLSRTGQNLGGLFVGVKVDEDLFEELETALIMADAGMEATEKLLT
ncbi:MAG TPA: signal recognition particle receptor subunit alpha, partial [Burkholderiaceae bacterium]|nr:signal recognition particle receptor subunit alpha [Burkholderiaceae bacterium]